PPSPSGPRSRPPNGPQPSIPPCLRKCRHRRPTHLTRPTQATPASRASQPQPLHLRKLLSSRPPGLIQGIRKTTAVVSRRRPRTSTSITTLPTFQYPGLVVRRLKLDCELPLPSSARRQNSRRSSTSHLWLVAFRLKPD